MCAPGAVVFLDGSYFVRGEEECNEHIFRNFELKFVRERRQTIMNLKQKSHQTMNGYADGWQSQLNDLKKLKMESFFTLIFFTQAASDAPPVPVPYFQRFDYS